MDSWESLILQWINCLSESTDQCIRNLEQLEDGKIYHKLIGKIKPWNRKEYNGNEKEIVLQYLQDEYPMYIFETKNNRVRNLCIASLVLSRLSLEPIFHKSLCTNLSADMQIKIKLVLESIYQLGKNVTEEDFFKIFSLPKKPEFESPALKPKFLLEEFLKSPITRTVQSDSKLHEQSKQLRRLRADIETLTYEKSELIEDIKGQEKQIKGLQNKLHETMIELKSLRQSNFKINDVSSTSDVSNATSIELTYKKEVESLENYVSELQNENCQLQDEKSHLTEEIKMYKEKYSAMKEKNKNHEQIVESMLLQIEKKEEELAELKIRHEELCNHLREKTKLFFNNCSFELEDKTFSESSFNKSLNRSEALSSVIEVQLQDTKRELVLMQNNFKYINSILTTLIEEYDKLKRKAELLAAKNLQIENEICEPTSSSLVKCEEKLSLADIFKSDYKRILFFDLLNNSNNFVKKSNFNIQIIDCKKRHTDDLLVESEKLKTLLKYEHDEINFVDRFTCTFYDVFWQKYWGKQVFVLLKVILQEIIKLKIKSKKNSELDKSLLNITKFKDYTNNDFFIELLNFVKNNCEVAIKRPKVKKCLPISTQTDIKHYSCTSIQTDIKNFSTTSIQTDVKEYISKPVQTEIKNYFSSSVQTDIKNYFSTSVQTEAKEYSIIPTQTEEKNYSSISIQTDKIDDSLISPDELKSLQVLWTQITEFIQSDTKVYEKILVIEKNWSNTLELLKNIMNNYDNQMQTDIKEILVEKDIIENEMKNIQNQNLKTLLFNFITSVQMVTKLSKSCNIKVASSEELESTFNENFIKNLSLSELNLADDNYLATRKEIPDKIENLSKEIDNFDVLLKKYEEKLKSASENIPEDNDKDQLKYEDITTKLSNEDISKSPQFQKYMREIHEKYETKLEKMKEKMKAAFNNQIQILKKEQELNLKSKMEALQSKFENQCFNHTENLKKYKKHIGELTTQLWDVGEKLIVEKQTNENLTKKIKKLEEKYEDIENHHEAPKPMPRPRPETNTSHLADVTFNSKIQNLRGFQIMGNAFSNEDEEGEVFDSTCLADMQRPRESLSSVDLDRLSILQIRNSKCKPHLKSSYPTEAQLPVSLTEDDIKSGNPDDFLNDSLSQSLLTGKKVKRKDRSKNNSETPRRARRFSNIFRKPRLAADHK